MMGVEPLSPGAKNIRVHPKIGNLKFVSLKTSFITGPVEVNCRQSENKYTLKLRIPGGVKADIKIPALKGRKKLYINGVISDNKPYKENYHLKNLPSGISLLEVK